MKNTDSDGDTSWSEFKVRTDSMPLGGGILAGGYALTTFNGAGPDAIPLGCWVEGLDMTALEVICTFLVRPDPGDQLRVLLHNLGDELISIEGSRVYLSYIVRQ